MFFGTTSPSADGGVAWDYRGWITKFRSRPRGSGRPQVLIFLVEPRKVAGEWRPAQLRDVRLVAPKLLNLESILDDWH